MADRSNPSNSRHVERVARLCAVLGGALLVGGCPPPPPPPPAIDCFPEDSRDWIARTEPADDAADPASREAGGRAAAATIYVDRSISMKGFLAGETAVNQPFSDLVTTMPATLQEIGLETQYRGFGRNVSRDAIADGRRFLQSAYYECGAVPREQCESVESHLDEVFERIKTQSNDLAIVITDLWFDNSEAGSSALAKLQPSLKAIVDSDRAIAVYGVPAPFDGMIYGLPAADGRTVAVPHRGEHPLFMLVVGRDADVADFNERLKRSGSRLISDGVLPGGTIKRALFTASPTVRTELPREPLSNGNSSRIHSEIIESWDGLYVQQFIYDRSADDPAPSPGTSVEFPTWSGPSPRLFAANSVWQGPTQLRVRVWRRRDKECTRTSWTEIGSLAGDWPRVETGEQNRFVMEPALIRTALRQEGTYVLAGELQRLSVDRDPPATVWMTQWSLAHSGNGYTRPATTLFPTLNLSEFARITQNALADAAEQESRPLTGFTIMVGSEG